MQVSEIVIFNGVKYRRYPDAKAKRSRFYFVSHKRDSLEKGTTTLHRDIWKSVYGEIPKGFHIHHIDGNPLNNTIENLECLSHKQHQQRHAKELGFESDVEYWRYIQSLGDDWRKTEEGKRVKSNQSKGIWQKRVPINLICACCNQSFQKHSTRGLKNVCCSQKCTIKLGMLSGEYKIQAQCQNCSKEFSYMKYKTKKTCSKECQSLMHKKVMLDKITQSKLPK